MQLRAEWTICGIVIERRVKTSDKAKDWSQPTVRVQTLGDTFDLDCPKDVYDRTGEGELLTFTGRFERRPGKNGGTFTNFIASSVAPVKGGAT